MMICIKQDASGKISPDELKQLLNGDTIPLKGSDIEELIKQADIDGDGEVIHMILFLNFIYIIFFYYQIDYNEFLRLMRENHKKA